jgi:hypothetical protein
LAICPVYRRNCTDKLPCSLIRNCISATKVTDQISWINERMEKTTYDVYRYSYDLVLVFGILGNILVIMSILRQKKVLKNNYYFLVLHLAMCDLGALITSFVDHVNLHLVENRLVIYSTKYCAFRCITYFFQVAAPNMMLIISLLR